jgi:hypothetical protein
MSFGSAVQTAATTLRNLPHVDAERPLLSPPGELLSWRIARTPGLVRFPSPSKLPPAIAAGFDSSCLRSAGAKIREAKKPPNRATNPATATTDRNGTFLGIRESSIKVI